MKPVTDRWTVVFVGAWNTRLLGAPWLSNEVFDGEPVEARIPVTPGLPLRFEHNKTGVRIVPSEDRLVIGPTRTDDRCLRDVQNVARQIVGKLLHTPIRAMGVNFVFSLDDGEVPPKLAKLLDSASAAAAKGKAIAPVAGVAIRVSITKDPARTLNLAVARTNAEVVFDLNHHHETKTCSDALAILEEDGWLERLRAESTALLRDSYGLEQGGQP